MLQSLTQTRIMVSPQTDSKARTFFRVKEIKQCNLWILLSSFFHSFSFFSFAKNMVCNMQSTSRQSQLVIDIKQVNIIQICRYVIISNQCWSQFRIDLKLIISYTWYGFGIRRHTRHMFSRLWCKMY